MERSEGSKKKIDLSPQVFEEYVISVQMVKYLKEGALYEWHKSRVEYIEHLIEEESKQRGGEY